MKRSDAIKRKFEKIISQKDVSVEEIFREMFGAVEKEKWSEIVNLLKSKAKEDIKTNESKISLLTLYWLRYDEQTSTENIPRDGLFLKDDEIPKIIFDEGHKILLRIKKGDYSKENLGFLKYIISALQDLEIDFKKSMDLLNEIEGFLTTVKTENEIFQKLNTEVQEAIDNRKNHSS